MKQEQNKKSILDKIRANPNKYKGQRQAGHGISFRKVMEAGLVCLILSVPLFAGERIKTVQELRQALASGRSIESVSWDVVNPVEYLAEEVASGRMEKVSMEMLGIVHPFAAGSHGFWIKVYEDCFNAGYDEARCSRKIAIYIMAWSAGVYVTDGKEAYDTYVQECTRAFDFSWQDYVTNKKATEEFIKQYVRKGVKKTTEVRSLGNLQGRQDCFNAAHKKYEAVLDSIQDAPPVRSGCVHDTPQWLECERAFERSGKAWERDTKARHAYDAENKACCEKWGCQ